MQFPFYSYIFIVCLLYLLIYSSSFIVHRAIVSKDAPGRLHWFIVHSCSFIVQLLQFLFYCWCTASTSRVQQCVSRDTYWEAWLGEVVRFLVNTISPRLRSASRHAPRRACRDLPCAGARAPPPAGAAPGTNVVPGKNTKTIPMQRFQ